MPKKKRKLSQREQSEQFIETARELGAESSEEEFDKALDVILYRPNKSGKSKKRKSKKSSE